MKKFQVFISGNDSFRYDNVIEAPDMRAAMTRAYDAVEGITIESIVQIRIKEVPADTKAGFQIPVIILSTK